MTFNVRKQFGHSPFVPTPSAADDSTKAANTEWVRDYVAGGGGSTAPTDPAGSPDVWFYADDAGITVDGSNQPTAIPNNGAMGGNFVLDATATKRGVITASALNGLPSLRFGGDDYLRYTFPSPLSAAPFRQFIVMRRRAGGSNDHRIFSLPKTSVANDYDGTDRIAVLMFGATTACRLYRNNVVVMETTWAVSGLPWNPYYSPVVFELGSDGTNYRFGLNGLHWMNNPTDTSAATSLASTDLIVGAAWEGSAIIKFFNGDICEVVSYFGGSTPDEATADLTRRYLGARWGIPVLSML